MVALAEEQFFVCPLSALLTQLSLAYLNSAYLSSAPPSPAQRSSAAQPLPGELSGAQLRPDGDRINIVSMECADGFDKLGLQARNIDKPVLV